MAKGQLLHREARRVFTLETARPLWMPYERSWGLVIQLFPRTRGIEEKHLAMGKIWSRQRLLVADSVHILERRIRGLENSQDRSPRTPVRARVPVADSRFTLGLQIEEEKNSPKEAMSVGSSRSDSQSDAMAGPPRRQWAPSGRARPWKPPAIVPAC